MGEIGYSFRTQERLKDYCKNRTIHLEMLWFNGIHLFTIGHTSVLKMINYCSLGDYENAVEMVMQVYRFHRQALVQPSRRREFLTYYLRAYFFTVRCNLECGTSHDLTNFSGKLDEIRGVIRGIQLVQGFLEVDQYMKTQCDRFKEIGSVIFEEFKTLKQM